MIPARSRLQPPCFVESDSKHTDAPRAPQRRPPRYPSRLHNAWTASRAQRGRLCTQGATAGRACKGADGRQTPRGCTLRSFQRQRRAAQTQRHSLGAAPCSAARRSDALVTRRAAAGGAAAFLATMNIEPMPAETVRAAERSARAPTGKLMRRGELLTAVQGYTCSSGRGDGQRRAGPEPDPEKAPRGPAPMFGRGRRGIRQKLKAYRKLALQYHPDKNADRTTARLRRSSGPILC